MLAFFLMPFLVHHLNDTLYGIWILVGSLTGYGVLLDFGIRVSIVKFTSQYNAAHDQTKLNHLFNTGLTIYSVTGAMVVLAGLAIAPALPHLFKISPQYAGDAKIAFLIVCMGWALKFPAGVFEGFLNGIQRYDITNGITITGALLKAAAIFTFIGMGHKVIALALIMLTVDLLTQCAMVVLCFKYLPFLRLAAKSVDRKMLKVIFQFGLYSFIIVAAMKVMYQSDAIILGAFLPAQAITFFAVASNLIGYLREVSYGFAAVFSPAASEARGQERTL